MAETGWGVALPETRRGPLQFPERIAQWIMEEAPALVAYAALARLGCRSYGAASSHTQRYT